MIQSLTSLIATAFARRTRRRPDPAHTPEPVRTGAEGRLDIPMPDPTAEDRVRDTWQNHGLRLARQEDWDRLSELMHNADTERSLTPGGMSVAELLAFGARADVVGAVEHALFLGDVDDPAPLLDGIEALEIMLGERQHDPMAATIVALAHMDIGWAWRGNGPVAELNARKAEVFEAHLDRARDILEPFAAQSAPPAILLAARGALMRGQAGMLDPMARVYDTLIDLSPMDTRQMRSFGVSLLPRWNGSYARLDLEARRIGARVSPIWGAGGYTWVMFDAISVDPEACAGLDVEYFLDGMRDILALRGDQFTVNLLAAYAAVTMAARTGRPATDHNRARIRSAGAWIVCDYMTELHPLIWAHAAHGFDNALRVRSRDGFATRGAAEARRVLDTLFLPELARGQNVVFTENGPRLETG